MIKRHLVYLGVANKAGLYFFGKIDKHWEIAIADKRKQEFLRINDAREYEALHEIDKQF